MRLFPKPYDNIATGPHHLGEHAREVARVVDARVEMSWTERAHFFTGCPV